MKKTLIAVCAGLLAWTGSADVLLWQIETAEAKKYKTTKEGLSGAADYAVFYYYDEEKGVTALDSAKLFQDDYAGGGEYFAMEEQNALQVWDPGVSLAGKSFWIELYATDGEFGTVVSAGGDNQVAWSKPISYDVLKDYITVDLTALSPIYHPHVTPEPTGGILFLLGAGLLALRRRR